MTGDIFGLSYLRVGIYAGVAVLFLCLATFAGCEHRRAGSETVKRLAVESQRDQVIADNATQLETIERQGKALDQWATIGVTPQDVINMLKASAKFADDLQQQLLANARARERDRAKPNCDALMRVDLAAVCPLTAGSLREYEGRYPNGDRGSKGAGVRATPGQPHGPMPAAPSLPSGRAPD
jgi:hypothetical protein